MKRLPYYLLEPDDRIKAGDFFITIGAGNLAKKEPCHPSWADAAVRDCPQAIYLRPISNGRPRNQTNHGA
jgi:hypothetical protein